MSKTLFLIPVGMILGLGGFVTFWCLIVKMLSVNGWQRLAQYQVLPPPSGLHITLGQAEVGGVRYRNVVRAGAQAEGLSLKSMFMFRIGHPPLLIPWSAIGPVISEKSFWGTYHRTSIRTENGDSVRFEFSSDRLAEAMQAWLGTMGRPPGLSRPEGSRAQGPLDGLP